MNELYDLRLDLVLLELEQRQIRGEAPAAGDGISPEFLSNLSKEINAPISAAYIRKRENIALAKARHAMQQHQTKQTQCKS